MKVKVKKTGEIYRVEALDCRRIDAKKDEVQGARLTPDQIEIIIDKKKG